MSTGENKASATETQAEKTMPVYRIDEAWIEQSGRSLQQMIESRAGLPDEEKGGKKRRKPLTMADVAKIEGFVNSDLPILEAVFRLLLVHQNKPMDVEQISHELAESGVGIRDARSVRPETLVRILDSDSYYGIKRHEQS